MALAFSSAPACFFSSSLRNHAAFSPSPKVASRGRETFHGGFCHFPSIRPSKSKRGLVTKAAPPVGAINRDLPAPDLPSHLYRNRIVYLGMPLSKPVMGLTLAELVLLQRDDSYKPIYLYINSTGVVKNDERLGYETEAFSLYDMMSTIKPPIFTLCVGNAWGEAALLLAAGERGSRAALPSASIMIKEPLCRFQGQAIDADIAKEEIKNMKNEMVNLLAKHTGQKRERIEEDIRRPKYFTADEALEYGLIDKVLYNEKGPFGNGVLSQL